MPFKTFVAGEEALASDVNSLLMGQSVARFTNATQRAAQLTSPTLNQLSATDDRPGLIQYWTGSAWVDANPPAPAFPPLPLPSNLRIEWGSGVVTTDVAGMAVIPLGAPFSGGSVFVAMDGDDRVASGAFGSIGFNCSAVGGAPTNSHLYLRCTKEGALWVQNTAVRINYVAIGPR